MQPGEFPQNVALGAVRTPMWSTLQLETPGGWTDGSANWADARHAYDVTHAVRSATDYEAVLAHFHDHRGRCYVFLFKDFLDSAVTLADGVGTLVPGTTNSFQLGKRYGTVNPYYRKITRPVEGTVAIYRTRDGVRTFTGLDPNYNTGVFTTALHHEGDTYQWIGEFRVPLRYGSDKMPAVIIDREPGAGELLVTCEGIQLVEEKE